MPDKNEKDDNQESDEQGFQSEEDMKEKNYPHDINLDDYDLPETPGEVNREEEETSMPE